MGPISSLTLRSNSLGFISFFSIPCHQDFKASSVNNPLGLIEQILRLRSIMLENAFLPFVVFFFLSQHARVVKEFVLIYIPHSTFQDSPHIRMILLPLMRRPSILNRMCLHLSKIIGSSNNFD